MSHPEIGSNRTGVATSPIDTASLVSATKKTVPSRRGDATAIADTRIAAAADVDPVGTMPPPGTVKGVVKTVAKAIRGMNVNVFIDKLGERLAFERTGTRLYDGLLSKFDAYGSWPGGPTRDELLEQRNEELAHFEMIREAIVQLGADPTVMTPSADLKAVASSGILLAISDPRTNLLECLDVMLTAELTDNDAFEMLVQLAKDLGQDRLAVDFESALIDERRHLARVRGWVSGRIGTLLAGRPSPPPRGARSKKTAPAKKRANGNGHGHAKRSRHKKSNGKKTNGR